MRVRPKTCATAAVGNYLVTHDGVSDETAYQMTKLLFENLDRLTAAHAAAKAINSAKALRRHAGAAASGRRALLQGSRTDQVGVLPPPAGEVRAHEAGGVSLHILDTPISMMSQFSPATPPDRPLAGDPPLEGRDPCRPEEIPTEGLPQGWGEGRWGTAAFAIAIAFSLFQLYTAAYGTLPSQVVRAMHVGFLLLLGFALVAT